MLDEKFSVDQLLTKQMPDRLSSADAEKAVKMTEGLNPEYADFIKQNQSQIAQYLQGTLSKADEQKLEHACDSKYPNLVATSDAAKTPLMAGIAADSCTLLYINVGVDAMNVILSLLGVSGAKGPLKSVIVKNLKAIEKLKPLFKALASAKSKWEEAKIATKILLGLIGAVGYAGIKEAISHLSVWEWIKLSATLASWVATDGAALVLEIFNLGAALTDLVSDTQKLGKAGC